MDRDSFNQFIKIKSFILQEKLISFIFQARETYKEVGVFRKSLFSIAFTLKTTELEERKVFLLLEIPFIICAN